MRALARNIYIRFVFTKYSPRWNDNGTEVFPLKAIKKRLLVSAASQDFQHVYSNLQEIA